MRNRRVAKRLWRLFVGLAKPERQHVRAAQARIGDFPYLRRPQGAHARAGNRARAFND
ncbi:hypothetical protein D3C81_2217920 [compost metagenome]